MNKLIKGISIIVIAILTTLSSISITFAANKPLTDYETHWAKKTIESALASGIMKGYPDGTIRPNNNITRAEFFSLVNNAFGFDKNVPITYSDIKSSNWAYPVIATAQAAGYITGYPDDTIRPGSHISRQEAAVIISRIDSLKPGPEALPFTDASKIAVWSKQAVLSVYSAKIMNGYPDGSFKPVNPITRAETLVTVLRALDARPVPDDTEEMEPPVVPVPPVTGNNGSSPGGNGNGGGGNGGGDGGSYTDVVEYLIAASFTGAFTSDLKVRINGQFITDYSLYYNNELVATTSTGTITTVSNVFSDLSKLKILYNGSYYTSSGKGGSTISEVELLTRASFENALTADLKVKMDDQFITSYSLYYNNAIVAATTDGVITTANNIFGDLSKLKIQYNGAFWTDTDSTVGTW